jgi:hypothetical protein
VFSLFLGSNGELYCVLFTFISDLETVRSATCECKANKRLRKYWCKHIWAVVLHHCDDNELIRLCAIASAAYVESPEFNVSPTKSVDRKMEDDVARVLDFDSPPPKIRRSADNVIESPRKIVKLNKSLNDVKEVKTGGGGLNLLSSEVLMVMHKNHNLSPETAICKVKLKENTKLLSFNKVFKALLEKGEKFSFVRVLSFVGFIAETENSQYYLTTKGIAFVKQKLVAEQQPNKEE